MIPRVNDATLVIDRQVGKWGTEYDTGRDVAHTPMQRNALVSATELRAADLDFGRSGNALDTPGFRLVLRSSDDSSRVTVSGQRSCRRTT